MDVRAAVVAWPQDAPRGAVRRFCEEHDVSRSWFYQVRARARIEPALTAMAPRPRRAPIRHRQAIAPIVEDLAVRIRKELADQGLDHGPVTVRWHLQQLGFVSPAASTLARVFSRHGMVVPQPQKRPRTSYRRFSFAQVHECWQLDAFEWPLADGTTVAVFQLLDDCSRVLVASHVASSENATDAITVADKGIAAHQVPCLLLTDNGAAFNQTRQGRTSQLVTHLSALGARAITGRPGHPQTQGKDERVHQTLQRWLRARPPAHTLPDLQQLIDQFDIHYNQHRPHQSLGMRTPDQALREGPFAIPPRPPEAISLPTQTEPRARAHKVDSTGKVSVRHAFINLGTEHAGTQVTVVSSGQTVNIFDAKGHHLRSAILEPGKRYYGNGRPRGRRPKPKVSTLT